MRDYLLDNNIISTIIKGANDPVWAASDVQYQSVANRFASIGSARVFLPTVAIAEIEFGLACIDQATLSPKAIANRKAIRAFFGRYMHLGFDSGTIEPYTLVRARLWRDYGTPTGKRHKYIEVLPEELFDNQAGKSLGIDEKDLLIFSVSLQYGLTFATCDGRIGMRRILAAAHDLEREGKLVIDGKPAKVYDEDWNT